MPAVSGVKVSPRADEINYPRLSEEKAIKLAAASPEVREEFTRHGPHSAEAKYKEGAWTVRFYVDERGAIGGRPTEKGKEVATVGVDDKTWVLDYVYTGDQVGWNLARGVHGAYGKQANYWWVWLPLALAFAAAFWRTDRLFTIGTLAIVARLGFLVASPLMGLIAGRSSVAVALVVVSGVAGLVVAAIRLPRPAVVELELTATPPL